MSELEDIDKGRAPRFGRMGRTRRVPFPLSELLEVAGRRTIPPELQEQARVIIEKCVNLSHKDQPGAGDYVSSIVPFAVTFSRTFGVDPLSTLVISLGLGRRGPREALLGDSVPWNVIWAAKLTADQASRVIDKFEGEIRFHANPDNPGLDHDLAYISDPVKRILSGEIFEREANDITRKADSLVKKAGEIYPSIIQYDPRPGEPPNPDQIIQEIDKREAFIHPSDEAPPGDDVPF
jgi:hypothetical protein